MSSGHKKIPSPGERAPASAGNTQKISRAEFDLVLTKVRELAQKTPQKAAMILTEWLKKPRKLESMRADSAPPKKKAG